MSLTGCLILKSLTKSVQFVDQVEVRHKQSKILKMEHNTSELTGRGKEVAGEL